MVSTATSIGVSALALFVVLWAVGDAESDGEDDGSPAESDDEYGSERSGE